MKTPLRILHLEDDPKDTELVHAMLQAEGIVCDIVRVDTRDDYLAAARKGPFDLILADYSLPQFDGLSALAIKQEHCPDVPYIFVSGIIGEEVAIEGMKSGATDYVLKNRLSRLVPAMRRALLEAEEKKERKRAEKETQRNLERIQVLHDIDKAITSTLDLRAVLDVLVEKTVQLLPYSASLVWLRNPQTGSLERAACWNLDEKEWKESKFLGTPLLVKTAIDTQAPIAIRNIQTDPRTMDSDFYRKEGLVSYLGIPLIAKNKVVGVLVFLTREEHEFARDETEFLVTLADQAAIAIHNSQLYEEMRNMAGSLAKSNRVKDEFLSVMSHELRTPLTAVIGYTGLLQDGMIEGIGQEKALQKIMKHSGELLSMINSILQATSLETDEVTARMHEIHLSRILDDIRSAYDFPLEKELTLHWDYAPDLPVIRTDGGKLKQILQNLINNAIKFTEKGTVTVSARITSAPLPPSSPARGQGGRGAGEQGGRGELRGVQGGRHRHRDREGVAAYYLRDVPSGG